jgi:hypothetical protein
MRIQTVVKEDFLLGVEKASQACGLSHSSFMRMAAKEKINRMAQQINTVQSSNLNVPGAIPDYDSQRMQ